MSFFFRWSCLLGLALLAPTALPAGGGEMCQPSIRRREENSPLLSNQGLSLFLSPILSAPTLYLLENGTPLEILHSWHAEDGSRWFYVKTLSGIRSLAIKSENRGWISA